MCESETTASEWSATSTERSNTQRHATMPPLSPIVSHTTLRAPHTLCHPPPPASLSLSPPLRCLVYSKPCSSWTSAPLLSS